MKKAKGETTHYVFEGTEPIFEKKITAGKVKSYVYALGKYLARVDGVVGDPEAKKYFYHTDHAGSIRVITDQAGEVVYDADYLAFGSQYSKDGDFEEFHGFTGKEYDPDIGLYYFNARWYDPDLGRFISEDPAGDPNNPNLYSYGANNPVMMIDPSGQFVWSWLTFFKAIFTSWVWGALQTADVIHEEGGDFWKGFWYGLWGKPTIGIRINFDGNGNYSIGPRDEDVSGGIEYPGEVYGGYYDESYEQFQSDQYGIGGDVLGPLSELLFGAYFNESLEGIKSSAQLGYRNPLKGDFLVTSPFHQIRSIGSTPHLGIDFGAPIGTPVLATADGIVVFAGLHGSLAGPGQKRGTGFGYCIVIYHGQDAFGNHVTTMYSHLSEFAPDVTVGQKVQWGQEIGKVGSTGLSTGPHLDYTLLVTDHIPFRINNGVLEIERNIDTAKDPQHYPWTGL